ncbi:DUF1269 domain-containing protein [Phytohabitans rumicis]|uniref:Membrane protein n=1 Tax=Phytohabitans rumicis TaxID=1076125 RepID=A0A6V8LKK4_9ACTN|nr:DUF1269 domain-containing protein [Phytohabitans rumicis]GFJ96090.1 membrane protein [Phytohabitans rumicis]
MSDLIAIGYADLNTAQAARDKLLELQRQGLIKLQDAAVVEATPNGKVKLHQGTSLTGMGAAGGALWGGLIGLLFFAPFLGMALGAAGGAIGGKMTDVGVDDKFMKDVGQALQPGTAALFLLVEQVTLDKVVEKMTHERFEGRLIRSSLSSEAEQQLRDAVEKARMAVAR